MVLPILLNEKFFSKKKEFIKLIEKRGLETRPIISGSFVNQPSAKLYNLNVSKENFIGAQKVQDLGFVIGLSTVKIDEKKLKFVTNILFSIDSI